MPKNKISRKELMDALDYDPATGIFRWKRKISKKTVVGAIAGTPARGYVAIQINMKLNLAHRLAWLYVYGFMPKYIDHKNGDRKDNRIGNLRECTMSQNHANKGAPKSSKSGVRGVYYRKDRNKYYARIGYKGKTICLGLFDDLEEADATYAAAARALYGKFAYSLRGEA
jgi:hypothetical protein